MLRIFLKVLVDHVQRRLKDGIENEWDFFIHQALESQLSALLVNKCIVPGSTHPKLVNDIGQYGQDERIFCGLGTTCIVAENRLQQWGNQICHNAWHILGFVDVCVH